MRFKIPPGRVEEGSRNPRHRQTGRVLLPGSCAPLVGNVSGGELYALYLLLVKTSGTRFD